MNHIIAEKKFNLFAQYLVAQELLDAQAAEKLSEEAHTNEETLISYLERKKILDSIVIANAASQYFSMPLYDLSAHDENYLPQEFCDLEMVQKYYGLPILKRDNKLIVAIADPNAPQLQEIAFMTGYKTEFVLVEADKLRHAIDFIKGDKISPHFDSLEEEKMDYSFDADIEELEIDTHAAEEQKETITTEEIDDRPVVRFVNKILLNAIKTKTSDIHFEPYEHMYRVRYRQDGVLYEIAQPPIQFVNSIVARLKVMANLDISERRVPQDGRFKLTISKGQSIDFRVSTCPTLHGEKVVMRLLDAQNTALEIEKLGMNKIQQKHYMKAINMSQGMILVTGPTGSGKTITLYSALRVLNTPEQNISTIEDPVEIYMEGVNQVQVNPKTGMTFANALRSFLRQDPDIIMVGEIRDLETAEIAIKAAQTGHLVFSTLHTNNAPATLSRLLNMGVKTFNVASSVTLVMAQRLVRKLCPHCKQRNDLSKEELLEEGFSEDEISDLKIYGPGSCDHCTNGYKGRIGIFEVMPISPAMEQIIMEEGNEIQLAEQAKKDGVTTIHESGREKIRQGLTSIKEVNRVIND